MRSIRVSLVAVAALLALATTAPPVAVASDDVPTVTASAMPHPAPVVIASAMTASALDLVVLPMFAFDDMAAIEITKTSQVIATPLRSPMAVPVDTRSTSIGSEAHMRRGFHARDRPGRH